MVPDYAEAHIAKEVEFDNEQFVTFLNIHDVTGGFPLNRWEYHHQFEWEIRTCDGTG